MTVVFTFWSKLQVVRNYEVGYKVLVSNYQFYETALSLCLNIRTLRNIYL